MGQIGYSEAYRLVQVLASTTHIKIDDEQIKKVASNIGSFDFNKEPNVPYARLPTNDTRFVLSSESDNPFYQFEVRRLIFNADLMAYLPSIPTQLKEQAMRRLGKYRPIMRAVSQTGLIKLSDIVDEIKMDKELMKIIHLSPFPYSLLTNRNELVTIPGLDKDTEISKGTPILTIPGITPDQHRYVRHWQGTHTIDK